MLKILELGVPAMEPQTTFNVRAIVKVDMRTSNINKCGDLYWSDMCVSNNEHQKIMCGKEIGQHAWNMLAILG